MLSTKDIELGLLDKQFCLFYQPKLSLASNRIHGSEALIRWRLADGAIVPPSEFIPLAAQSFLIREISDYIVTELFAELPALHKAGLTPVSFNLTARDFQDEKLTRRLLAAFDAGEVAPAQIEIEITEGDALDDDEIVLHNVRDLRAAGVGLAMDDYGVGYSSVDTLSRWPFSCIKIDQGLIRRMLASDKNARIVLSAIRMAHELNLDVVAEGVEADSQLRFLLEAGCRKVQGYLISKPLSLDEVAGLDSAADIPSQLPVGEIHMAIIDQIQWRKHLISKTLKLATLPSDAPEREHAYMDAISDTNHRCMLLRWYRNGGRVFSHLPNYAGIGAALEFMNDIGTEIMERIRAGETLEDLQELIGALQQGSIDMLDALTTMEDSVLSTLYSDARRDRERLPG